MGCLVGFMYRLLHIEIIRLLKKKRRYRDFSVPNVNEVDIYKFDPSELPGLSETNSDEQVWNFFSAPYKKYAKGKRPNRTARTGYWKITGKGCAVKDKANKVIGNKKTLVFHKRGSASEGNKTDWVMHEFYAKDSSLFKNDFVFCYIERNPSNKSNISSPDIGQPSQSLVSDSETNVTERTFTEVESQQPSSHHLIEVESQLQSNHNLVPDPENHSAKNTSTMVGSQLLLNHNLISDPRNHFLPNTSMVEPQLLSNYSLVSDSQNHLAPYVSSMVETQLLSNHNLVSDPMSNFVPIASSMDEPQLLSNHNLVSNLINYVVPTASSMVEPQLLLNHNLVSTMVEPQLLLNHNLVYDPMNHCAPVTSSMIEPSNQYMVFNPRNSFEAITSPMVEPQLLSNHNLVSAMVEPQLLSNHNLVSGLMNYFAPITSSMIEPHVPSNQNMVFNPRNSFEAITSPMVEPQLPSDLNLVSNPRNHSAPNNSSKFILQQVEPQLLSNQNMDYDPSNHFAPYSFSMQVEPQLQSNHNLVSNPRNHLAPNTSLMVEPQVPSNHNVVLDPRNNLVNTFSMVDPQQLTQMLAELNALFLRYLLNQSSFSTPQLPINPEQGSYYSSHSSGFGNDTVWSSQFHSEHEDVWNAQRNFQDNYPHDQVTEQTLPADTDINK